MSNVYSLRLGADVHKDAPIFISDELGKLTFFCGEK